MTDWLSDWLTSSCSSHYYCCSFCCCCCCSAVLRLLIKQFIWISTMFIYLFFFRVFFALAKKKEAQYARNSKTTSSRPRGQTCICKQWCPVWWVAAAWCLGLSRCKESSPKNVLWVRVLDTDQTIPDDDCLCLFIGDWFEYHLAWHTSWQGNGASGCECVGVCVNVIVGGLSVHTMCQSANLAIFRLVVRVIRPPTEKLGC